MGVSRVHLVLSSEERARFKAQAEREGRSLSEWLRRAGRARLEEAQRSRLATVEDLDGFFTDQDVAETGREPDWSEHLGVIARSRGRAADT
jgi:hypothetical protein